MVRKLTIPTVASLAGDVDKRFADKGLAVRDGLREVRFNVKHGARKLLEAVEAATHTRETSTGALGPLGKPLNRAVRKAADLLSNVDDAAVSLLSPDADYRAMDIPLQPSAAYFGASAVSDLRQFTTDHHWRYRHWLGLSRINDVFVHEQAIAIAGAQAAQARLARSFVPTDDGAAFGGFHRQATAVLVQALAGQGVLSKAALLPGEVACDDELPELLGRGAVVTVLAGEIAVQIPTATGREGYARALRLADEIAVADRAGWQAALRTPAAAEALGRWFGFVLRHL